MEHGRDAVDLVKTAASEEAFEERSIDAYFLGFCTCVNTMRGLSGDWNDDGAGCCVRIDYSRHARELQIK